ncbi:chemotaxis protein CheR [Acidisoma sp. 7E03]
MSEKPSPEKQFEALLEYIQESQGLDFRGYKRTSLRRRIILRMEAAGAVGFASYQTLLDTDPAEFAILLNTILINVTSFFRDTEAWEVLRSEVLPRIIASREGDSQIRVWSIGCASGEEPYSLAMLFAEALGLPAMTKRVKIYGTDLDEEALQSARQAIYSPRDVESVPADLLEKYFDRSKNHYVVNRELRKCVIFGRHNVVRDAPISRIDLLVCRNLLIYLESDTQDIVLPRLYYALSSSGFLFLGKAETQLGRSSLFRPVDMKHRIFAKMPQQWRRTQGGGLAVAKEYRSEPVASPQHLVEAVLNESATAFLVVDDSGMVTLANETARELLSVGEADIGRPFQDLPVSYRPVELRNPIEEVLQNRRVVRLEHQEFHLAKGESLRLTIELRPLFRVDGTCYAVLLTFVDTTSLYETQRELQTAQENLQHSIEELQSANEELETTNEELQSTNEELETTNEELQSTNEELETINEEARSSNEEMESANEELRILVEQASSQKAFLESILRTLNVGVVVLDGKLVIQSWNRWSENTWGLRAEEVIGTNFDALEIGLPVHRLRDDLIAVLVKPERQVERILEGRDRRGRKVMCRVKVAALVEDQEPTGAVLAFTDIGDERRQEDQIRYLGRVFDQAPEPILFLDPDSISILLANRAAEKRFGGVDQPLVTRALADLLPPQANLELIRQMLKPSQEDQDQELLLATTLCALDGEKIEVELSLRYLGLEVPPVILAVVTMPRRQHRLMLSGAEETGSG